MKETFRIFHKRPLSNDPAIKTFFPHFSCSKTSNIHESVKDSLVQKEKEGMDGSQPSGSLSDNPILKPEKELIMANHPPEPVELDHPIRCPPPEPSIIQDARREVPRLSNRRRSQLPFLTESELRNLQRRRLAFGSLSAHEPIIASSPQ